MTRLYQEMDPFQDAYPRRQGVRNFTWTTEAIADWEAIWHDLWHLGYKWEWQNSDRYARRRGDKFNLFACHDDAVRLDMAIPLPGISIIQALKERLLDDTDRDRRIDQTVAGIDRWLKKYLLPRESKNKG